MMVSIYIVKVKEMATVGVWKFSFSDGEKTVSLPDARVINISPSAPTEKDRGTSTIRFLLSGEVVLRSDWPDTLADWYGEEKSISWEDEVFGKTDGCSIREFSVDPSNQRLYLGVFTPIPFPQLRHWFTE